MAGAFVIEQEQTRKFWAGWVRRQIGGSDLVQDAATSAAVDEILQGRDNHAAEEAARRMARSLGVNLAEPVAAPAPNAASEPIIAASVPAASQINAVPELTPGMPVGKDGQPLRCRLCGSVPAANMTIHEHNGRIIWMVHKTNRGPYCRDCGTALLRHHQNSTLFQGWFGMFSFFITPVTLLLNLNSWRKIRALGPPQRDPNVPSKIPAPLNAGKPLIKRPGAYVGGLIIAAAAGLLVLNGVDTGGCLDNNVDLGNRMTELHNTFVVVYNRDLKIIEACQSVDCEQAPKLEIASSLRTYNDGLGKICWPSSDQTLVNALVQANTRMADAYQVWAGATNPVDDQTLGHDAQTADNQQSTADDALSNQLGVPAVTPPSSV